MMAKPKRCSTNKKWTTKNSHRHTHLARRHIHSEAKGERIHLVIKKKQNVSKAADGEEEEVDDFCSFRPFLISTYRRVRSALCLTSIYGVMSCACAHWNAAIITNEKPKSLNRSMESKWSFQLKWSTYRRPGNRVRLSDNGNGFSGKRYQKLELSANSDENKKLFRLQQHNKPNARHRWWWEGGENDFERKEKKRDDPWERSI